ncbi:hypothetical protein [Paenibacillus chungangensis]|uniref:Uncharacterized protein n=1 Tax=Paenibacillus chungangensis TaxID=696535 RepID=A0ABW3HTF5_9BACL
MQSLISPRRYGWKPLTILVICILNKKYATTAIVADSWTLLTFARHIAYAFKLTDIAGTIAIFPASSFLTIFSDRTNDLIMDGWIMIRFSYDDVTDNPRLCQQYVQQLLGKLYGSNKPDPILQHILPVQREILRFISRQTGNQICSPMQIATSLSLHPSTVRRNMKQLVSVGLLEGASATQAAYIRRYRLTVRGARLWLH